MNWRSGRLSAVVSVALGVTTVSLVGGRSGKAHPPAQADPALAKVADQVTATNVAAALKANAPGLKAAVKGTQATSVFIEALQRGLRDPGLRRSSDLAPKLATAATSGGGEALLRSLSPGDVDAAVRIGLKSLTGLVPPAEGLQAHALRAGGRTLARADTPRIRQDGDPDSSQPVGDWRIPRVMMSVDQASRPDLDQRHQNRGFNGTQYAIPNDCGSCWAFGTVAAFEHSYAVRFSEYINISEQEILNFADPAYSCNGGWWAFDYLLNNSISSESQHRYIGDDPAKAKVAKPRFKASRWGYVTTGQEVPPVQAIKDALCEYGPLAVGVNATPKFSNYVPADYPDQVFVENDPGPVNHAIVLVGWDDTKGGGSWVIRNSWGGDWGESGFMRIGYTTNRIGYGAAWVEPEKGASP